MFKRFWLLAATIISVLHSNAQTGISDSVDIVHTTIQLRVTDFAGKTIQGIAALELEGLVDGITEVPFDLLALAVDSVKEGSIHLPFERIGEKVIVSADFDAGTNKTITIYYQGEPEKDDLWGGWYWSGDYAYQMGVGFVAEPHNYGRVWYPCFDNFKERSTFSFHITAPEGYKAFCGGILTGSTVHPDGTVTWNWELEQSIPSYLASVAVSTYATVEWEYTGAGTTIPVQIGVKAVDSNKLKDSFVHLNDAMTAFENGYGPYRWDRIGYVAVPFSGGAMEHACNIAYPNFAIDGGLNWESLMAHELAHSWWGNLVTCSEASEMWLNEGWASFSEFLFTEHVYGTSPYREAINNTHLEVIRYGYAYDGNVFEPLAGVTHANTYGYTTYTRGALTIHNLRGYMGDALFFDCISSFLDTYSFQPVSSEQFRDHLTDCSGIDMSPFFEGWIFNAGTPAFEFQSNGLSDVTNVRDICIQQKLNKAPDFFGNVPLEIFFVNEKGHTTHIEQVIADGPLSNFSLVLPESAESEYTYMIIDRENHIADAVTADELFLTATGEYELDFALMDIEVNALNSDTDWLRIEHYWVAADGKVNPESGLHLHNQRYWRVMGGFNGEQTTATIRFNGTITTSGGYLDNEFITNSDDSLVLLYRADPQDDWTLYPHYELDPWANKTDKRGEFEISRLLPGEYAFGIYDYSIPDAAPDLNDCIYTETDEGYLTEPWKVFPNPGSDALFVEGPVNSSATLLRILDLLGITHLQQNWRGKTSIDVSTLPEGNYIVCLTDGKEQLIAAQKVLIIR